MYRHRDSLSRNAHAAGEAHPLQHKAALLINYDPTGPSRLLSSMYDGSMGSASRAMMAVDQFVWQLGRRNL
ncbi:hypothetical protein TorRG33x02_338170 [Trema orientale]|uniref:Uncharacterized protein n=1 Tax=Trema orientale TaxID=63057 RepID=A0A2P5AXX1_TREOI|nr:hypothetical protein TorRG33x02_338170 [Trema orientale]